MQNNTYRDMGKTIEKPFKVDEDRLKRQHYALYQWYKNNCVGTFEWATGTGKSYLAILGIRHLIKSYEDKDLTTLIVVPTDYLRNQWKEHIKNHQIPNAVVDTVHNVIKDDHYYDILVLDEVHSYTGGEEFSKVFDCVRRQFVIGLTAQERDDPEDQQVLKANAPIVDKLPLKEALEKGYVSQFTVYNLGLELDKETQRRYDKMNKQFIKYFSTFDFNLTLMFNAIGDDKVCENIAKHMQWSPKVVKIHAVQANRVMQQRKKMLYSADILLETALKIIEKFPNTKTLTFSEVTSSADKLNEMLEEKGFNTGVYHSSLATEVRNKSGKLVARAVKVDGKTRYKDKKGDIYTWKQIKYAYKKHNLTRFSKDRLKEQVIEEYRNNELEILNTARALNVGANIPGVENAILTSFNSSTIDSIQRTGRAIRKVEGKRAREINLYIKNSQSEKWLRSKQTQTPNVQWIESVSEIV